MISFIIPALNEEKMIGPCVESILAQRDLPEFEIIVVDNGSTDKTHQIVRSFPKPVRLIEYTAQKSPSAARNAGAKNARGDILVFFDADIIVPQGWVRKMIKYLSNNKLVAVSGQLRHIEFNFIQKLGEKIFYWIFLTPVSLILRKLRMGSVLIGGNAAVKRWAFDKIGGFDPTREYYGDDANLARRLIKIGDVKFINNLWVRKSARRYLKEGYFKTEFLYVINFFSEILLHKPATKNHHDVR